jgi:uroporphyrinogen-III synthase
MSADPALQGLGVVITRPRAAAEALAASLTRHGARAFVFPALAIEAVGDSPALDAALALLPGCDIAIFVSANAVERGLALAGRRGGWPVGARVAAIGEATAEALRNSGFARVISPPERHDSEALLAQDDLKAVEGRNILIFRGKGGRELLRETLEARGARVTYVECYRRVRPAGDAASLIRAWTRGEIQAVSVLSAETLENFIEMIGADGATHLASTTLVVPHAAVASHPLARRFADVLITPPGAEGMLASLRVRT